MIGERGTLVVLTCREKPDRTDAVTIEIGERFYHVAGVDERADGDWSVIGYRLRENPPGALIRRLIRYDLSPGVDISGTGPL